MESVTMELSKMAAERKGSTPVKRRVSRACDHCHRMRTRCNGQHPCSRCIELEYVCQYNREKKRRGKVPRHVQRQREEAQRDGESPDDMMEGSERPKVFIDTGIAQGIDGDAWSPALHTSMSAPFPESSFREHMDHRLSLQWQAMRPDAAFHGPANGVIVDPVLLAQSGQLPYEYEAFHPSMPRNEDLMFSLNDLHLVPDAGTPSTNAPQGYGDFYPMQMPMARQPSPHSYQSGEGGSPRSMASVTSSHMAAANASCRYPVLKPLLPHLGSTMSSSMACDLLEFYFQSSSSVFLEPVSPYILGVIFRKRSFLRQHKPRRCNPALLASMLWVAVQTSNAAFLTSSPSARGILSQRLWQLTIDLLKPLVHAPAPGDERAAYPTSSTSPSGPERLGVNCFSGHFEAGVAESPIGDLDDVATYVNLATVTSASEYKAASLRWWNAAWSLARELKLGKELPPQDDQSGNMSDSIEMEPTMDPAFQHIAGMEEIREERRRLWWLLYMVDRHLALCYNRPLFLLDNECEELYRPVEDGIWQAGEYYTGSRTTKRKGLTFECIGHDVFGYFLPLMTILGDIIHLNHGRNHPRFRQRSREGWDPLANEIRSSLERYAVSLEAFKLQHCGEEMGANVGDATDSARLEWIQQTRKVVAYGTHIMNVLHILVHGKWDPLSLLNDDNQWICSPAFLAATGNAVSAAHAVEEILEQDPDLSFMPYFFGMYLLQGSLILLLLADRLQTDTNEGVIRACETIVRAHEAAVVTLDTAYQRNFRKIMISTLAQIKGVGNPREHQTRRREVLALYRWTSEGNGLAI